MPPKRGNSSFNKNKKLNTSLNTSQNGSISNFFNNITSKDPNTVQCDYCKLSMKSCLLKDHMTTKCKAKLKLNETLLKHKKESHSTPKKSEPFEDIKDIKNSRFSIFDDDDEKSKYIKDEKLSPVKDDLSTVTMLPQLEEVPADEPVEPINLTINVFSDNEESEKEKTLFEKETNIQTPSKKLNVARKSTSISKYNQHIKENLKNIQVQDEATSTSTSSEEFLKKGCFDEERIDESNIKNPTICYALKNFMNAIESVFEDKQFVYLLNDDDLQIVNNFHQLSG